MVIDPRREHIAVAEARKLGIKVVALLDTDCDPDGVDLPIPGNDDSVRSIELVIKQLFNAIIEGKTSAPAEPPPSAGAGQGQGEREGTARGRRDRRRSVADPQAQSATAPPSESPGPAGKQQSQGTS